MAEKQQIKPPTWIEVLMTGWKWWEYMSGALSIPLMIVALFVPSSTRVCLVILGYLALWAVIISERWRHHKALSSLHVGFDEKATRKAIADELAKFRIKLHNRRNEIASQSPDNYNASKSNERDRASDAIIGEVITYFAERPQELGLSAAADFQVINRQTFVRRTHIFGATIFDDEWSDKQNELFQVEQNLQKISDRFSYQ